jgi:DNA polymerase elongation subunit (family B)
MQKSEIINEIKTFLDGSNDELKYMVNIETDPNTNVANCIIHEPNHLPRIELHSYVPFMYMKDLKKYNKVLYHGDEQLDASMRKMYGIEFKHLNTGNQKRLKDGFTILVTSTKSFNAILNYFKNGGIDVYEKAKTSGGRIKKNSRGDAIFTNKEYFYSLKTNEQFLINRKARLFKGIEEYKEVHKLIFDIETTGLKPNMHRIISIGLWDNRGYEKVLEAEKEDDDESEINLIKKFFEEVIIKKPAIIAGFNSENFDFEFIVERAKILNLELDKLTTTLSDSDHIKRFHNASVKIGSSSEKYTATKMWGFSIIDIMHAAKRTAAQNTEMKNTKLKYLAKFEEIAKPNRTYIEGNKISSIWKENKIFVINEENEFLQIPDSYQKAAITLHALQVNKDKINPAVHQLTKKKILDENSGFVEWFRGNAIPRKMVNFIRGKKIVEQYNIDDLWETAQLDELYNQSSFLLAKIVPTSYQRVCTMGTAGVWNLLMSAWSYDNDLAIPINDKNKGFSGGLARCYRGGFNRKIKKIDYASLYPMIQLSENVFPIFDITGVMRKMLTYMTTTRNIYKKLANSDSLESEELELLRSTGHEDTYNKYINGTLTDAERKGFKIKQLPIKILNNSLFGSLGSGFAFNWSDNDCASRITCTARLHLRHAISWFSGYGCIALLAVTDGINFHIPDVTNRGFNDNGEIPVDENTPIDDAWSYKGLKGIKALILKYNTEEMKPPFMSVDDDGDFISCLNLSRINYALLYDKKNKKTGEIERKVKLTGNSLKSKTMPEYIEEFIDKGMRMLLEEKGAEFVEYYYDYAQDIYNKRIPLRKIASKSKVKVSIDAYMKRGKDKNGREKGKQAHMELLINERNKEAREIFRERFEEFKTEYNRMIEEKILAVKPDEEYNYSELQSLVGAYMSPPPEIDSVVYYVNTGYRASDADSAEIDDREIQGKRRMCSAFISSKELEENPDKTGNYNIHKYFRAFNNKVKIYLEGFDPEIKPKILAKIKKKKVKDEFGNKVEKIEFVRNFFSNGELELKSIVLDSYDDSMLLEDKEIEFWNKTGYDPRKIWSGFIPRENNPVRYEIYENALKYLNKKMADTGKPNIKTVNDEIFEGDYILLKNNFQYSLGHHNGQYIDIVRENLEIPKSETELEIEKHQQEQDEKLKKLIVDNMDGMKLLVDADEVTDEDQEKLLKYFEMFKEKHSNLPPTLTLTQMLAVSPTMKSTLLDFIDICESEDEDEDILGDDDD